MATAMFRCSQRVYQSRYLQARHGYVVLLPEIPNDTPETNALLREGDIPRFSEITAEKCVNAVGRRIVDFESGLMRIEESVQEPGTKKDFQSIINPIEKLLAPLDNVWSTVKRIMAVRHTPDMIDVYNKLHIRVMAARSQRFQSLPLCRALGEVNADKNELTESQKRVVDKYLLEAKLNGLQLSGSSLGQFNKSARHLYTAKETFRSKVREATKRFRHKISDYTMVRDFPVDLLQRMAFDSARPTQGPWEVTLRPEIYESFMKHCSDRDLRWNAWNAYNSRCSGIDDPDLKTSVNIENIRYQRSLQAKLLGYPSYVHLSLETKMAGTLENVLSVIDSLKEGCKPAVEEELASLQNFAQDWGFDGYLQLWDVPYWRLKQRQSAYELNEENLRCYFPFARVINQLFDLTYRIFGVSFKDATNEVDVWDENVRFYRIIHESGQEIASLYLDPYCRAQKMSTSSFLDMGIGRCDTLGIKPSSFLVLNLPPPVDGKQSLMDYDNVAVLFQKFGSVLQHSLTTIGNIEAAGLENVEWDAVDVCSKFMSFWLTDARFLHEISGHCDTGDQLEEATCQKIVAAIQHFASYDIMKQLYLSAFDLEMYSSKTFWMDVMKELWPKYMPFPLYKNDSHPCSFSEIFCDELPAAYYSSTWSEMIAADVFRAFQEGGLGNTEHLTSTGKRFRETFLNLGGGCHSKELFRRFRGRDPSPDALLRLRGIKN